MGDDIRIRVGVASNVKAGMDRVVKDIDSRRGGFAKSGGESGKGFAEAFGKVLRGDISGAVEDLQNRMGGGMKGLAAKATVWGAGIATAFVAGWKAGGKIDEMLGLSDKLGGWLAGKLGTQQDEVARIELEGLQKRRKQREADAEAVKKIESDKAASESAGAIEAPTREEVNAFDKDTKERVAAAEDAEKAKRDAAERTLDFEKWIAEENKKIARETLEEQKRVLRARIDAMEAAARKVDIGGLQNKAGAAGDAAAQAWRMVEDPNARKEERDAERAEKRREFKVKQAMEARARGITGPHIDRILGAAAAENKAKAAQAALDAAVLQQAKDIAAIRAVNDELLTMKGP